MARIIRNVAQCLLCGDVIESKNRYDYCKCSCGNLRVTGGTYNVRHGSREGRGSFVDMSVFQEEEEGI